MAITSNSNLRSALRMILRIALLFFEPWRSLIRSRITQNLKAKIYGILFSSSLIFLGWNLFVGKSMLQDNSVVHVFLNPSDECKYRNYFPDRNSCTRLDAVNAAIHPIIGFVQSLIPFLLILSALQCGYLVYQKLAENE
jgi:hypothetical protein